MARISRGLTHLRTGAQSLRRKTGWEEGPGGGGIFTITGSSSIILGAGTQALNDGLTLVRLRGRFSCYLSAAAAANEGYIGAFGIGICTNAAFAVGVSAVPTPITEIQENIWLFHQFIQLRSNVIFGGGIAFGEIPNAGLQQFDVDSKAMRKLRVGDTIYACLEVSESGTATMRGDFDSRVLVKLP